MIKIMLSIFLIFSIALPASAIEVIPPEVPQSGEALMPQNTSSLGEGLWELLGEAIKFLRPDITEAVKTSIAIIACVMIISLLQTFSGNVKVVAGMAGSIAISALLLSNTHSMICLGVETIRELSDYGKLLFPVMTAAMAAQGGVTSSTALYTGTAVLDTFLSSFIAKFLIPLMYLFLVFAVANSAIGEEMLKKISELLKSALSWCLKTILMVFTTYMSITGVVSGTTDAAALKATKITISSVVPVVGGILSDASEAVLVSAGLAKNAAGIYGILAILSVFLEPFLQIGTQYLVLKATSTICSIFAPKGMSGLIDDFAAAMGLLLAMTGSICLLLLISTVCFMKGVG